MNHPFNFKLTTPMLLQMAENVEVKCMLSEGWLGFQAT